MINFVFLYQHESRLTKMKHLIIKHTGPINEVDIELHRINLLIGEQSSGKSTINKIACYCSWVEKEISIAQSASYFETKNNFESRLSNFHKLEGFFTPETYIEYETDVMYFSFSKKEEAFHFEWKDQWSYIRPKTIYIPAERNIVATIPNWFDIKLKENNIRSFMSDWEEARNYYSGRSTDILNLGVQYSFDKDTRKDRVLITKDQALDFTNVSSGLQSLIPLWILLKYVTEGVYNGEKKDSVAIEYQNRKLIDTIYSAISGVPPTASVLVVLDELANVIKIGNRDYLFDEEQKAKKFQQTSLNFIYPHFSNIFLEEPEENLYPLTQRDLIFNIASLMNEGRSHNVFLTTHSPYILTSLNNLLYASNVGKKKKDKARKVIPMKYWVQPEDVGAWSVKNGRIISIMDKKLKQIKAEKIDEVSRGLNRDFDKLLDIEYETD